MTPAKTVATTNVVIDASGQILGRLAVRVANSLRGKDSPMFDPSQISGQRVLVTNAEKIRVSGRKTLQKVHYHHTQWPRGLRSKTTGERLAVAPERVIVDAVKGMLPKNRLRSLWLKRLTVVRGVPETATKTEK